MVAAVLPYLALLLALLAIPAAADNAPRDIYFLAIGNEHYVDSPDNSPFAWDKIAAPVNSATRVAALLQRAGAKYGILLTSNPDRAISKNDMKQAIVDLKARIRRDGASRPLILFYYIGHGLGDAHSQLLYLAPGNMPLTSLPTQTATIMLIRLALTNVDVLGSFMAFRLPPVMAFHDDFFIGDAIHDPQNPAHAKRARQDEHNRASGLYPSGTIPPVPFIALFDNCYGGVEQDLTKGSSLTNLLVKLTAPVRKSLLKQLALAQSDGLVLYAAKPGDLIGDFANPDDDNDPLPVGSLARRLMLALRADSGPDTVTLGELRTLMAAPEASTHGEATARFNPHSPLPYSFQSGTEAVMTTARIARRAAPGAMSGQISERIGTASH